MHKTTQIYGIRAILEAINSDEPIDKVFLQKGLRGDLYQELEALVRKKGINAAYVPVEKLNRLTKNNHQGAVANISPITFYSLEQLVETVIATEKAPLFLILDQVSDVRNFGAIIRTAECTGVDGIIIIKTSAGAAFKVPIAKVDHVKDAVFYLQASGIVVVAATEKTKHTIYDVSFKAPCAIIMGAEDRGISPSILKASDHLAKFLYEVVRQRRSL